MTRPSVFPMAVVLVLATLSGCATKQEPIKIDPWLEDKQQVMRQLEESQIKNLQLENKILILNDSLSELKDLTRQQQRHIDALMASFRAITKTVKQDRKTTRKEIQALKQDDQKPVTATPTKPVEKAPESKLIAKPVSSQIEDSNERNMYSAAYLALKSKRYAEASSLFEAFIKQYPTGEYTDQANYWLSESLLPQKRYEEAEKVLTALVNGSLESSKRSAALLTLADVQINLNKPKQARATLQLLLKTYPKSLAAKSAKAQLNNLQTQAKTK